VPNEDGERVTPSCVAFTDKEMVSHSLSLSLCHLVCSPPIDSISLSPSLPLSLSPSLQFAGTAAKSQWVRNRQNTVVDFTHVLGLK